MVTGFEVVLKICGKKNPAKNQHQIYGKGVRKMVNKKALENTLLYKENAKNDVFLKEYFDLKKQKFIHNVDSLYYTVDISSDWNEHEGVKKLVEFLNIRKNDVLESTEDFTVLLPQFGQDKELKMNGIGFSIYSYDIESQDEFIVFVARKVPTKETPPVIVQIRSQYLWLNGEHHAVQESFAAVSRMLESFGVSDVSKVKLNRLDLAYHTNYIQNMTNFFREENLNAMQVSRFRRYSSQGEFVGDWEVEKDYLALGRRTSNNIFVRIYNKNQEVVKQGYKQFFIELWLKEGLINKYDHYCLSKCFVKGRYDYLDRARLEFYKEHGRDRAKISEINKILYDPKARFEFGYIRKLANKLTPKVTVICNIEFQTKRKFYASFKDILPFLKPADQKVTDRNRVILNQEIFRFLDNKNLLHDYLTFDVLRFIDYKKIDLSNIDKIEVRKRDLPVAKWWERLRATKMHQRCKDNSDVKLIRKYQKTLDYEKMKKRVVNSITTLSIYDKCKNGDDLVRDVGDFVNSLNESDIESAIKYKSKKLHLLGNRLLGIESADKSAKIKNSRFRLVDDETGEVL